MRPPTSPWLTPLEAAEHAHCHRTTVYGTLYTEQNKQGNGLVGCVSARRRAGGSFRSTTSTHGSRAGNRRANQYGVDMGDGMEPRNGAWTSQTKARDADDIASLARRIVTITNDQEIKNMAQKIVRLARDLTD